MRHDDLLTADERVMIDEVKRLLTRGTSVRARDYKHSLGDLLNITRDLHHRATIAIRDERYKWRNMLVDLLEEMENGQIDADNAIRVIYERIASEQDKPEEIR